jgi:membrane associated rhomboid family serine protease
VFPYRDVNPSKTFPFVTIILIVANVLVFFFEASMPERQLDQFIKTFGLVPGRFDLSIPELSTVMFSMFMHGSWSHLIGNMWSLWLFGDNIEDVCGHFGYLCFYIACGIAAAMTQVFMSAGSNVPMVGASGAIAGVLGAYLVTFPHARIQTLVMRGYMGHIEVPAIFYLGFWFVTQVFAVGVGALSSEAGEASGGGVAFFAHIGGFVLGVILIKMFSARANNKTASSGGDLDRYY